MRIDKHVLLASTMLACAFNFNSGTSVAQTAPTPATTQDQSQTDKKDADSTSVGEVVVTGTRFKRSEYNSAAPIQVLSADKARLQGVTSTQDLLMTSTLIQGSFQVNGELTGFVTTGGPGVNTASLRGLGANRTLVLIDGQRVGPAGVRGTVGPIDLNTIPFAVVDSVEILKDGASAIYGSDAVAGVINVITKKKLDGGVINASTKQTQGGGGAVYDVNGAYGKVLSHGFWNIALDYNEQDILRRSQRSQTACAADYEFNPTTGARIDYSNLAGGTKCYNLFANAINTGLYGTVIYPVTGVAYPTAAKGNSGSAGQPVPFGMVRELRAGFPGTYPYAKEEFAAYNRASIVSPDKTLSVRAAGGYSIGADTEVFGDILLNRRESAQDSARQYFPSFSTANPNNPFGTALGSLLPIIPMISDQAQQVDYFNVHAGAKGKLPNVPGIEGWHWQIDGSFSRSYGRYGNDIIYNDATLAVTGALACNPSKLLPSISGRSCSMLPGGAALPAAAELSGNFTSAEKAFLFGYETGKTTYLQSNIEATIGGDLFDLPAGKLGVVLGGDYRSMSIDDIPGINQRNGNLWGQSSAGETKGSDAVTEAFIEIDAPLLKNLPLIRGLDFQASSRYTNYNSYGGNSTYRLGLVWSLNSWLTLRGTHGTSFRAPELYELYLANQTSFANQLGLDPCINWDQSANVNLQHNCQARGVPAGYSGGGSSSAVVTTGGGKGHLSAETSTSDVWGFVFAPKKWPIKVALDYTQLQINNEVSQFGSANIANQCFISANPSANPFCSLLTTGSATPGGPNQILTINNSYVNISSQNLRAIDLTFDAWKTIGSNRFAIRVTGSWEKRFVTQTFQAFAANDYTGTTYDYNGPQFVGNVDISWKRGPWYALWTANMVGHGSDQAELGSSATSTKYSSTCHVGANVGPCSSLIGTGSLVVNPVAVNLKNYVEATVTHTLSLQRTFDGFTMTGAVRNIFDQKAPNVSTGEFRSGTAALNGYEDCYLGRQFYVSLSKKF